MPDSISGEQIIEQFVAELGSFITHYSLRYAKPGEDVL